MKIGISCDHAGFELKNTIRQWVMGEGRHEVIDFGTNSATPVDYPDFAALVGRSLQQKTIERGIVICGSGVGATIAANKLRGVRACVCHDVYSAHQGVEHDDMNCLVLGSRVVGVALAFELVEAFLSARFTAEPRHLQRLQKVLDLEKANS